MTRLEKALYTKWISRFGRAKIRELADGLDAGRSIGEKSEAVVKSSSENDLNALLLEGFTGFFHQTVFMRRVESSRATARAIKRIPQAVDNHNSVTLETLNDTPDAAARGLVMATTTMEFLPAEEGPVVSVEIPFPIAVGVTDAILTVQVLTMQSTVETWGDIIGRDVKRMLSFVHADALYDDVLNFLLEHEVPTGDYMDYSSAAVRLLKRDEVDTYSGTMEVGTAGSTKHNTVRGKGCRPLRQSMRDEFQKLVSARRIVQAEIELNAEYLNLKDGSKVALYPTVGKMAFRSNLGGCDPDEFIKAMATE